MKKTTVLIILVALTLVVGVSNYFGISKLQKTLDGAIAGEPSQQEAGEEALPSKAEVSADDDPFKGSEDAPVTIIEFSEFQCPYCGKYFQQTYPQINENYVKTGKVKYVFRDFPLGFHQFAQKAAEAAECADEQGKFWEYHDTLFNNQDKLDISDLKKYAADMKLDADKFGKCLDSGKYASEVKKDLSDGSAAGVSGTPSFFINGVRLVGAQPYEAFKQVIDEELG